MKGFISYSHVDKDLCETIYQQLISIKTSEGVEVWYDKGLIPGQKYRAIITEKIKECDAFIVLISSNSIKSEWVEEEIEYAHTKRKLIVPIFLENVTLPDSLEMILSIYHSLFYYASKSQKTFQSQLETLFSPQSNEEKKETFFENEFSQDRNNQMIKLLQEEKEGHFTICYQPENAINLGVAYLFGANTSKNLDLARRYFKIASYFGNPDAEFYLLEMRLEALPLDPIRDFKEESNVLLKYNHTMLGEEELKEREKNKKEAIKIVNKIYNLSENGSIPAKLYLGTIYWRGFFGYNENKVKSCEFYEYCAKQGNARAEYIMSSNYYLGDGIEIDYDLAIMYASLAYEQKYMKACRRFGQFYLEGKALKKDISKAIEYFNQGVAWGDYDCYNFLAKIYYFGLDKKIDYDQAFAYYSKAEGANANGQAYALGKSKLGLGHCYENGFGVKKDIDKALEKYWEGYLLRNKDCRTEYLRLISQK